MRIQAAIGLVLIAALDASAPEATTRENSGADFFSVSCSQQDQAEIFNLPPAGNSLRLAGDVTSPAWLEIEESGQNLEISAPAGLLSQRVVRVPPRYGWGFYSLAPNGKLSIARTEPGHAPGAVRIAIHCSTSTQLQARLDWFSRADALAQSLQTPLDTPAFEQLLPQFNALAGAAPDPKLRALGLHMVAQLLMSNGHSADASEAYASVELAWLSTDDPDRALAARVGRVEDALRSSHYEDVLALTRSFPGTPSSQSYFGVRLENSRCQAFNFLGRLDEADSCFKWVLEKFDAMDERGPFVNTLQSYASLQNDRGHPELAERLCRQGLQLVAGPDAAIYRGRIEYTLADLVLRRGAVVEALSLTHQALLDLTAAHSPRWEAYVMLRLAYLYSQMGTYDESYEFLGEAMKLLSARDAPDRIGVAMLTFANVENFTGHRESALWWLRAAAGVFADLKMPIDLETAVLARLELQLGQGELDAVRHALSDNVQRQPLYATRWKLLDAELALRENRLGDAREFLQESKLKPLALRERIRLAQLEAELSERSEGATDAQRGLLDTAQDINALAMRARSPVLRYIISRQIQPLQRTAIRLALDHAQAEHVSAPTLSAIWNWLTVEFSTPAAAVAAQSSSANSQAFDRAVAQELLIATAEDKAKSASTAQRELLSLLARPEQQGNATRSQLPAIPLAALQEHLDPDSVFVAYLDGEARGALLWVTHDSTQLLAAAPPDQVRTAAMALQDLLRSPSSSVADIHSAAQHLSSRVIGSIPPSQPPRRLYVLADEISNSIAWSTLIWPGREEPLIESTAVSPVRLTQNDAAAGQLRSLPDAPRELRVIVAARLQANESSLPDLAGASVEAAQIRPEFAGGKFRIDEDAHATRDIVLSALGEPGAWVHVAAHGAAQPQRIGYAGIWLESSATDTTPAFLSWLDILDTGVSADLVVLNACQLGDSGNAINGNLSFAAAVARAGAGQVVAALWPVSDSASALWVPAFYAALAADPEHDAAQALRAAQLRLRASRAFAHPFFWAGMQTITRLRLATVPSLPAVSQTIAAPTAKLR